MHRIAKAGVSTALALTVITAATGGVSSASGKSAAQQYQAIAKKMNKDFKASTADPLEKDAAGYERELLGLPVTGQSAADVKVLVGAIRMAVSDLKAANKAGSSKATQAKVNPAAVAMERDVVTFRHDLGLPTLPSGDGF
jgi:hypothetical protein